MALIDCVHKTPPAADSGCPYVTIPHLKEGRIDLAGVRLVSSSDFAEWTKKAKPTVNDVVLSRRRNPGETAHVPPDLEFVLEMDLPC
ncbi:MAG: hypothetical protein K2X87_09660 [Gemmataceae bacterium]|nr:hypothetical protein [Gemmataceae bacterium]